MPSITEEMIKRVKEARTKTERVFDGNFLHVDRDTNLSFNGVSLASALSGSFLQESSTRKKSPRFAPDVS